MKYWELQQQDSITLPSVIEALCQDMFNVCVTDDPIALLAKLNPNMLYYHKALKAPDQKQFIAAMH